MDQETGELAYGIEDSDYTMIGGQGGADKASEIDPTQAAARSEGRSPRMIFAGSGIKSQHIDRLVHPVDIASTLAAATGSKFTSGARGVVLSEVMDKR